jgi:hypothetical protein
VRQLLAGCLVGPGAPAPHALVADPSEGATYQDPDAALGALRAGAELVATQVNRIAVRDDGQHLDTGGWVRLLEDATGTAARVLGKPSPEFFTAPWRRWAGGRAPPWSSATTWPPTSAAAGRSGRPRCWSAAARGTAPGRAPRPNPTRSSTASPTCPDCSNGERADRQP